MSDYTEKEKAAIIAAYENRLERQAIADSLGVTTENLRAALRKWGVPKRPPVKVEKVLTPDDLEIFQRLRLICARQNVVKPAKKRLCMCGGTMFLQSERKQYYCCSCKRTVKLA
jgi:transposase-like protein